VKIKFKKGVKDIAKMIDIMIIQNFRIIIKITQLKIKITIFLIKRTSFKLPKNKEKQVRIKIIKKNKKNSKILKSLQIGILKGIMKNVTIEENTMINIITKEIDINREIMVSIA